MSGDVGALRDAIRRLRIELTILNDTVAEAAGLNPRDLDVLDVIDREGPCTPSWLAERTGQRRATLTSVLRRLEQEGWIDRVPDPADRRSVRVSSTARFDELHALYGPADAVAEGLEKAYSVREREVLAEVLNRVVEGLSAASRPPAPRET